MQTVTVKTDMCSTVLIYYKTRNKIFGECASFRRTCIWIRASYKGRIWTGENIDWIRSTSVITVVHSASANLRGGGGISIILCTYISSLNPSNSVSNVYTVRKRYVLFAGVKGFTAAP